MQTPSDLQPAVMKPDPFRAGAQFDHMTEPRLANIIGANLTGPRGGFIIFDCMEFDDLNERWICIQKNFTRPVAAFLRDYFPAPQGA